ncbi:MAG: CPBP family intramembrane metalloprotease [Nitrospira sp.]|nr:CPBP family intramembrane metalloprotease [Nitrospira sp.]
MIFEIYGVLPPADLPQPLFDAMSSAPLPLQVGWALMFIGLFPVIEEVLFRGFLFAGLAQSWGPGLGGLMPTLIFVGVHMPKVLAYWSALLAVSLLGSLTVLIRIRTGSLAPGIALHSTYNGVLVAAAFFTHTTS